MGVGAAERLATERSVREMEVPDLVPARMLNEFAYCPRLFYIEWVQGEFADSVDTVEGRVRHARVDRGGQTRERRTPPGKQELATDEAGVEAPSERVHTRSVTLGSEEEGLIARIDLIELEGNKAVPVDYKKGSVPQVPGQAWEPEKVQLCAQGLVLRANGYESDRGVIYYVESKTRVEVPFDEELVERTRSLLRDLRKTAASGVIPPPLEDSPKCPRCSLVGLCLPDEVNILKSIQSEQGVGYRTQGKARRLIAPRDDALPIYIQDQGARVGKKGERLTIEDREGGVKEVRLIDVSEVSLFGNVQISSQAVRELSARGIPVLHFTYGGWFVAMTQGSIHKNIELRMRQFEWFANEDRRLTLARSAVAGKIRNARTLLRRNYRGISASVLSELQRLHEQAGKADLIARLLGIEGLAARVYFTHFAGMLKPDSELPWDFESRNRRPPRDPINALLSFLYSMLIKDCFVAAASVGFDPYLGFYHAPKYGKPALALDLAEEFRPILADSVVLSLINKREISMDDFISRLGSVSLTEAGRRKVLAAYERRLNSEVLHPVFSYRVSYRRVLNLQARLLSRVLLGELDEYVSFVTR